MMCIEPFYVYPIELSQLEPVYNGNTNAFSLTLLGGYLNLSAYYLTALVNSG